MENLGYWLGALVFRFLQFFALLLMVCQAVAPKPHVVLTFADIILNAAVMAGSCVIAATFEKRIKGSL